MNKTRNVIIYSSFLLAFACAAMVFHISYIQEDNFLKENPDFLKLCNQARWHIGTFYGPILAAILYFLYGENKKNTNIEPNAEKAKTADVLAVIITLTLLIIPIYFYFSVAEPDEIKLANEDMLVYQCVVQTFLSPVFSYYFGVGIKGNSSKELP